MNTALVMRNSGGSLVTQPSPFRLAGVPRVGGRSAGGGDRAGSVAWFSPGLRRSLLTSVVPASAVQVSLLVTGVGACFGAKLAGRFAVSNVAQLVGLVILILARPFVLRMHDLLFLVCLGLSIGLAAVGAVIDYGYHIQVVYSGFYLLAFLYVLMIIRIAGDPAAVRDLTAGARVTILWLWVYFMARFLLNGAARRGLWDFGFDDRAHSTVYLSVLAMMTLVFLKSIRRWIVSLSFLVLAFTSTSRLAFVFLPCYFLIAAGLYRLESGHAGPDRARRERWEWRTTLRRIGPLLLTLVLVGVSWVVLPDAPSFPRLFGGSQDSTKSHLLLIRAAYDLKTENMSNFFLGITPRGFGSVLLTSRVDTTKLFRTDPATYIGATGGWLPIHSSVMTVFLEFPLWFFLLCCLAAIRLALALVRKKKMITFLCLASFLGATTFYSNFTEVFFFVCVVLLVIALRIPSGSDTHRSVGP